MLSLFVDIFVAPGSALQRLHEQAPIVLPLTILVLASVALNFAYFQLVDREFLVEEIIAQAGDELSNEDERRLREFSTNDDDGTRWFPTIGAALSISLMLLLHGTYYSLVSMFSGHGIRFRQWFGLVTWCSLPMLLAVLAGFVALMIAPGYELTFDELNPLSLTSLLNMEMGRGPGQMLGRLDVSQVWSVVLLTLGYHLWTQSSLARSLAVALIPYMLFYGSSALFIFLD
ncbi:MAG: YIP1 family protein [Pseudomonadota bacterium]